LKLVRRELGTPRRPQSRVSQKYPLANSPVSMCTLRHRPPPRARHKPQLTTLRRRRTQPQPPLPARHNKRHRKLPRDPRIL